MTNHKDQPPDSFKELADMMQGLAALAAFNRSCYSAHIEQGFSEEQALTLTLEAMKVQLEGALTP